MANATIVKPDIGFVNEVINAGGESLKKCYQCATCSVACNVTPTDRPFPRKEMVLAQWGQKEQLVTSPDVWLCHQCSDCTALCPRGAKPGEVLNAIRKISIKHVAMIPIMSRIASEPKLLPILFLVPMALFAVILAALGHLDVNALRAGGPIVYNKFMPIPAIDAVFTTTAAFAAFSAFVGIKKLWGGMKAQAGDFAPRMSLVQAIVKAVVKIVTHKKFADCTVNRPRQFGHSFLFFGFIGLFITTTWAVIYIYGYEIFGLGTMGAFHFGMSPFPNDDPLKLWASFSTILFTLGLLSLLANRVAKAGLAGIGAYFDWIFLTVVAGVGLTGMGSWGLRLADSNAGYLVYYIHLVFIWALFAYAPYSKFAHMFYRTTAMVFAEYSGRNGSN